MYGADRPLRFCASIPAMPIRREHRFFYAIDWPQLSALIRFRRAKGRCEGCGRPHGKPSGTLAMAVGGTQRPHPGATERGKQSALRLKRRTFSGPSGRHGWF